MLVAKASMVLNYKVFGEGFPIIILHGLLGSLDNWQTIGKHVSENGLLVFIVDQRNHGRSPHSDQFNYDLLSNDLFDFFEQHQIKKAHLLGHSMGGKVAMNFALKHADKVEKMIVVDISPADYDDKHNDVFTALFAADVSKAKSREAVETTLRQLLKYDETTVQFLLKSITRTEAQDTGFRWRFNLDSLSKNYSQISAAITSATPFPGKTLFIKGEKSNYINSENYTSIDELFPYNQLSEIMNAGHWVHAEKPNEFLAEVLQFLF